MPEIPALVPATLQRIEVLDMMQTYKADLALLTVTIVAAIGWLLSKFAMGDVPPVGYIGIRFVGAALVILPMAAKQLQKLNRQQLLISLKGGLCQSAGFSFWIMAVDQSEHLGEGAFIMSLAMILVPVAARLLYGKAINRETLFALPVALTGIALLALKGSWEFETAQLMFFGSAIFVCFHFVFISQHGKGIPTMALTFIQLLTVGIISFIGSFFFESWEGSISLTTWFWIVSAILVSTSFRYFLMTWGLKYSEPGRAALIAILEPVWTAILAALVLGEVMNAQNLIGCSLVFLGLLVSRSGFLFSKKRGVVLTS